MLRAATHSAHAALDRHPILGELASGSIADRNYFVVISAFGRVWRAVERKAWKALIARIPEFSCFEDRRSLLLDADILAFRDDIASGEAKNAPAIATGAQAAGALYVLEGSRLGGSVIADRLQRAGRPLGEPGYLFFGAPRAGVAQRWQHFRNVIDAHDWLPDDRKCACDTALATFKSLSDTLEGEQAGD
jgi:heme oxygenase